MGLTKKCLLSSNNTSKLYFDFYIYKALQTKFNSTTLVNSML